MYQLILESTDFHVTDLVSEVGNAKDSHESNSHVHLKSNMKQAEYVTTLNIKISYNALI